MSTTWDIRCRTCKDDLGLEEHGEGGIFDLIAAAKSLAALPAGFGLSVESDCGSHLDLDWFRKHAEHDLIPINEYGRESGQCGDRVRCECCGTYNRCRRPDKHEGDHLLREVTP
jgi:hypothetical protein